MEPVLKRLLQFAFCWRLFLTLFQASVNYLIEDFDSSADIDVMGVHLNHTVTGDNIAIRSKAIIFFSHIFNGLNKWDSIYFIHIAEKGYDYEQTMAFFPAFPILVSSIARLFTHEVLMIKVISYLFNFAYFMLATYFLYRLTSRLSQNNSIFTQITTLLFILNPATIFMMSSYTEAQFVFLQFCMMFCLETGRFRTATVLIACSMLTRSNGLLNIAFLGYFSLKSIVLNFSFKKENIKLPQLFLLLKNSKYQLFELILSILFSITPFIYYQHHLYNLYCTNLDQRVDKEHWCHWKMPLSYSYIQRNYWNVGFLRYYELKQLPNFILASPAIFIVFSAARNWLRKANKETVLKAFGLLQNCSSNKDIDDSKKMSLRPEDVIVYLLHALFLTLSGLLAFHVQILTRMICSSTPIFYWTCASFLLDAKSNRIRYFVIVYFLVYVFIGIVLHTNFYPWT